MRTIALMELAIQLTVLGFHQASEEVEGTTIGDARVQFGSTSTTLVNSPTNRIPQPINLAS